MNQKTFLHAYKDMQQAYLDKLLDKQPKQDYQDKVFRLLNQSTKKDPFLMQLKTELSPNILSLKTSLNQRDLLDDKQVQKHLELLKRRDQVAKDYKFDDYKAMMMDFDDVKDVHLKTLLAVFLKQNEKRRRALIKKYPLNNENIESVLKTIGPRIDPFDPNSCLENIKKRLKLSLDVSPLNIIKTNQIKTPRCIAISNENITLLLPEVRCVYELKKFIHELSKCIIFLYQIQSQNSILLRPQKLKGFATIVEQVIINKVSTRKYKRWIKRISLLENAHESMHALFELDLPQQHKQASKYYESLLTEVFEVNNDTTWAYHPHLINEPHTLAMKALGLTAYLNLKNIYKADKKAKIPFGPWLESNILDRLDEVEMNTVL